MRIRTGWTALMLVLVAGATERATAQSETTAPLPRWMAGCWIADHDGGRQSEECWTLPRGTMMLGSGHMFDANKSLSFEHMRIERAGATIAFIAQPNGAPPTRFMLEKQVAPGGTEPAQVIFINFDNDYPQRVTYRLVNGNLEAEIALKDGSNAMRWTFRRP
ncbi:MAG: hypothetical protein J0I80_03570 [Sphingomonas sp.]|nr:hypothetical protein [Sphingomonas sp.]